MRITTFMTRKETIFGWILVSLHLLILPVGLSLLNLFLPQPMDLSLLNFLVFAIVFLLAVLIFHRFLKENFRKIKNNLPWCVIWALAGFGIYMVGNIMITAVIMAIDPDFINVNDAAIDLLLEGNFRLLAFAMIFLVPLSEECMYRGLLFQGMYRLGRPLAYLLSTVCFALIHVVGYIGTQSITTLFLCFLQYLPAGIALAWAYEKTDSIWTPILMHMIINSIGITAML